MNTTYKDWWLELSRTLTDVEKQTIQNWDSTVTFMERSNTTYVNLFATSDDAYRKIITHLVFLDLLDWIEDDEDL